jgi:RecJ-like exonuclease
MGYEMFCTHCNNEVAVTDEWPHWWCCPMCQATGHVTAQHEPCEICDKEFSDKMAELSRQVDDRVIREGLICVKESVGDHLRVGNHYKVVSLHGDLVTVIDDSGEARAYDSFLFRSVGDSR